MFWQRMGYCHSLFTVGLKVLNALMAEEVEGNWQSGTQVLRWLSCGFI